MRFSRQKLNIPKYNIRKTIGKIWAFIILSNLRLADDIVLVVDKMEKFQP